jgi:peptidoglycan-associated lipoprotein
MSLEIPWVVALVGSSGLWSRAMRMTTSAIGVALLTLLALLASGCPDKKPKYPTCEGDSDCKAGEKCVNKQCVQCAVDADCGAGQVCEAGACNKKPGWCTTDGDCDNGQVCKDNQCTACTADAECGEGGRCINGGCLRKGQCRTNEDCAEDEDCVTGVCQKSGQASGEPGCKLEPIYFGFDQSGIPEEAKAILQKNSQCLSTTPKAVAVIGMTDPRGTDEYNIGLSDDRAQAVIDYLRRLGTDQSRLQKVPKGEGMSSGTDETGWAKDRRVEFEWR